MERGIGDAFQQETKHVRGRVRGSNPAAGIPETYKEYPDRPFFPLPRPEPRTDLSLDRALRARRSVRSYSERPLSAEFLGYLLWAANGIQRVEEGYEFRTAPSAGALYPIETYLVVNSVTGLPAGVYHYSVRRHGLEQLKSGDFRETVARAAMNQRMCAQAAVVFIWTAVFRRAKWRYHDRAYRYVYLDAGHIAQNLALSAVSLGLGSCHIGALFDDEVNAIVGVDGSQESAVYMTALGWPASPAG